MVQRYKNGRFGVRRAKSNYNFNYVHRRRLNNGAFSSSLSTSGWGGGVCVGVCGEGVRGKRGAGVK